MSSWVKETSEGRGKGTGKRDESRFSQCSGPSPTLLSLEARPPPLSPLLTHLLLQPHSKKQQTVQNEDYFCHAHNADGLVGIAFADADYPARAAFGVVSSALENYARQFGDVWRDAREDSIDGNSVCESAVASYQDPASADKLTAIQRDLDETKVVLHKTIESVLARGEKLDALVDKSADLSLASQMFYKQARKTNSCCKMM